MIGKTIWIASGVMAATVGFTAIAAHAERATPTKTGSAAITVAIVNMVTAAAAGAGIGDEK